MTTLCFFDLGKWRKFMDASVFPLRMHGGRPSVAASEAPQWFHENFLRSIGENEDLQVLTSHESLNQPIGVIFANMWIPKYQIYLVKITLRDYIHQYFWWK